MSILSKATTGAMIAGAALVVAACGGSAANNTANAPVDNGTMVDNGMAPDMNGGMPPADNTMPPPAMGNDMNGSSSMGNTGAMSNGSSGNHM